LLLVITIELKYCYTAVQLELTEERANSERFRKQSDVLRLELDHLLQQLAVYVSCPYINVIFSLAVRLTLVVCSVLA